MNGHVGSWATTVLPFLIVAVVLALRMRSMGRERPLRMATLWVVPLVYLAIAGSMLVALPPPPVGWALVATGAVVGAALGWYRGRLIHIERDAETGTLRQKASPLAMVLVLALVGLKLGARSIFGDTSVGHPAAAATLMTDAFLGFAAGLLTATRLELYLRARQLLAGT